MASLGNSGYEIARATGVCAATGRAIAVGEPFVAALAEREDEERLERLDYSLEAWESGSRPAAPLRLFGHWRAIMQRPEDRRKPFIDDAALMDLFGQLEGATEGEAGGEAGGAGGGAGGRVSFRYLLALMLIRKRLLKYEGMRKEREGGRAVMLVRPTTPAGATPAELVEVIDPGMDEAAIAEAVEQLTAVLSDGGSPGAGAAGGSAGGAS